MAVRSVVRRGLLEGLVITASILLAFTLDRWWDGSQTAAHVEEIQVALVAEFEAVASELRATRGVHAARRQAAQALAELEHGAVTRLGGDSIWTLWVAASLPIMTDPPRGALTSVISAGDLRLIEDQSLRSRLAGWENRLEDMLHTETNVSELLRTQLIPQLTHSTPIPFGGGTVDERLEPTLRDFATRNLLQQVMVITAVVLRENDALQDEVEQILAMLSAEVGLRP
jgi:hypothetical protein